MGVFRSLRHRNYRLFFGGQTVSLIGTWITRVATSWLVYRLTGSVLLLGVVGFCGQIPTLVLAPFAGVLVEGPDDYPRRPPGPPPWVRRRLDRQRGAGERT